MAVPVLTGVAPVRGPTSGGDLVRLTGAGFAARLSVLFGSAAGELLSVREESGVWLADVRTPPHAEGFVDVVVRNLDDNDQPIPGEEATLPDAYRFLRPRIARESDLTRLVRTLLRELKRQVIEQTSMAVALDYDDSPGDGLNIVAIAELPSLVLSGPRLAENRFFSINELREHVVAGPAGPEIQRRRPPYTVDLQFTLTAASDRTIELLNLMAAVATFLNRNRWVEMARDPDDPAAGRARWEMDPAGEFRTQLEGRDDVKAFTCGFVVRGFDIDEGLPLDLGKAVADAELGTEPMAPGGSS